MMLTEIRRFSLPPLRHEAGVQAWLAELVAREPPILANTAQRMRAWREDPSGKLDRLAGLIAEDASAAARVLRVANSALFQRSARVLTDLEHAISELGVDRVIELALTSALMENLGRSELRDRTKEEAAIALHASAQARALAPLLDIVDSPALRLCALFGRLGAIEVWSHLEVLSPAVSAWPGAALAAGCGHDSIEWDLLGFSFGALSDLLAQHWRLKESGRITVLRACLHDRQTICAEIAQDVACAVAHRARAPTLAQSLARLQAASGKSQEEVLAALELGLHQARAQIAHWLSPGLAEAVFKLPLPLTSAQQGAEAARTQGGGDPEPERPSRFEDLEMLRGAEMDVRAAGNGNKQYRVRFCGAEPARGILVMPDGDQWNCLSKGSELSARCFNGRFEVEFETSLQEVFLRPARCWMLSYPPEVRSRTVRAAHRVPTALLVEVSAPGSQQRIAALGADLSAQGMQIVSEQPVGDPGQRVRLRFNLCVDGRDWAMEREASVRHVRQDAETGLVRVGCIFEPDSDREARKALLRFIEHRLVWLKGA